MTLVDPLEHRQDFTALAVFHKAQLKEVPHLARLSLPPQDTARDTRTVLSSSEQIEVPMSHVSQHQRTFTSRVSRLWNKFTAAMHSVRKMSTQQVKVTGHGGRETFPTPMVLLNM